MNTLDTLESRDRWRSAWELATSGVLLSLFTVIVFIIGAAMAFLPQTPDANGVMSVEQWRAVAQLRLGDWFAPLDAFGLHDVRGVRWLHVPVSVLIVIVLLRIMERALRLWKESAAQTIADGLRLRVTDAAPDFEMQSALLRARRYRVRIDGDALLATRAPLAEIASLVMHGGLLLFAAALLVDIHFGWDVVGVRVVSGGPRVVMVEDYAVSMAEGAAQPNAAALLIDPGERPVRPVVDEAAAAAGDVRVALRSMSAGYYVSATSADGRALTIRTSNYLSPTTSAAVDFRGEGGVTVAVPEARLVVSLLRAPGGGGDQLRVYSVGAAEKVIFAAVEPRMTIGDVVLQFAPLAVAEVDASRRPGAVAAALGLALALVGAAVGLRWPMRRIAVRRSGPWVEFFADGRSVRTDVSAISTPAREG
jgi:hypothetical protein